ncbi:TetR/AcrR family transcriptional regulator [Blastococcus sp. URHD0036]|uniref:TetR/AcrR family transcriptional regulator n=1 Tax=Blastococcus sp. URHD0036 TaxID=1380356 RepID=UPI0018CC3022|nr:TetR/AcrR family transcriptional regulator [Blastococcus sp. URHD0036]
MAESSPRAVSPRTPGRMPRPARADVRSRLLEGARQVFADRGFAAATLDHVAAAAGFTKGAVYSNFAGKDELFLALMEDEVAARLAAIEAAMADARDLPEALAAVATELGRLDPRWQVLFLDFWQRAVREPAVREVFVATRREFRDRVTAVVAGFLARRGVAGWDAESLGVVLLALVHGLAVESLPEPGAVPPDLLPRVLTRLVADPGA